MVRQFDYNKLISLNVSIRETTEMSSVAKKKKKKKKRKKVDFI